MEGFESMKGFAAAPLLDALAGYAAGGRLGFHMPGHYKGKGFPEAYASFLAEYGYALDLTELPGLDNLAAPTACIEESQKELAILAGSKNAYYLVNGASAGLEAAMLAMSDPGMSTIIPAHCHTAIHNGLILTGNSSIVMPSLVDYEWGLPFGVDKEAAELWFGGGGAPDKAVWISVNPTYNGLMADLAWEREIVNRQPSWRWLVDEAHGVHLPYVNATDGSRLAQSAIAFGADVVVHSAHKMGTGLTQTGMLHCNRSKLGAKLRQTLNIMQSSSPSYVLMSSLDAWQAFIRGSGAGALRRAEELALELSAGIRALGDYRLWQDELPDGYKLDQRKITLSSRELGLDGLALADTLRRDYQIDVESAASEHVLLIVGLGHDEADISRMLNALKSIKDNTGSQKSEYQKERNNKVAKEALRAAFKPGQKPWAPAISPREAFFSARERMKLEDAAGRVAAVSIAPYPPGIPLVFPGMEISKEIVSIIINLKKAGIRCVGLERESGSLFIDVVAER